MGTQDCWHRLLRHLSSVIDVYDSMNALMSLGLDKRVRRDFVNRLVELCGRPLRIADVGCGPGTLLEMLVSRASYLVAIDPLPEMLSSTRRRLASHQHLIDCVVAVGEHLPLREKSVDVVTAAFSLRDFIDWRRGLDEFSRVARKCFAVLDIARRRGLGLLLEIAWWGVFVPLAAMLRGKNPLHYVALARTILRWATPEDIAAEARRKARGAWLERIAGGFAFRLYVYTSKVGRSGEWRERVKIRAEATRSAERHREARGGIYQGSRTSS